jgi:hypothetical protein
MAEIIDQARASALLATVHALHGSLANQLETGNTKLALDISGALLQHDPEDIVARNAIRRLSKRDNPAIESNERLPKALNKQPIERNSRGSSTEREVNVQHPDPKCRDSYFGRHALLAHTEAAIAAAMTGTGAALCVTGENGLGKSRFLAEVEAQGRSAGMQVASMSFSWSLTESASSAIGRFAESVLSLKGSLGASPDAITCLRAAKTKQAQCLSWKQVAPALMETISAASDEKPVLLHMDDCHCSPDVVEALITPLAVRADSTALFIVFTSRLELSEQLASAPVAVRRLPGLSNAEARALASSLAEAKSLTLTSDTLHLLSSASAGSPARITRLVSALARAVVEQDFIAYARRELADRLSELPERLLGVMQVIAAFGREAPQHLVSVATGIPTADLLSLTSELGNRGLLSTEPHGLSLSHEFVTESCLDMLGEAATKPLLLHVARVVLNDAVSTGSAHQRLWAADRFLRAGRPDMALPIVARELETTLREDIEATCTRLSALTAQVLETSHAKHRLVSLALQKATQCWNTSTIDGLLASRGVISQGIAPDAQDAVVALRAYCDSRRRLHAGEREAEDLFAKSLSAACSNDVSLDHRAHAAFQSVVMADLLSSPSALRAANSATESLPVAAPEIAALRLSASVVFLTRTGQFDLALDCARRLISAADSTDDLTLSLRAKRYLGRCLWYSGASFSETYRALVDAAECARGAGMTTHHLNVLNELAGLCLHAGATSHLDAILPAAYSTCVESRDESGRAMLAEIWTVASAALSDRIARPPIDLVPQNWREAMRNGWIRNRAHTLACYAFERSAKNRRMSHAVTEQIESDLTLMAPHGDSDVVAAGLVLASRSTSGATKAETHLRRYMSCRVDRTPIHFVLVFAAKCIGMDLITPFTDRSPS